ncbi:MAG: hypothetical protein HY321_04745 [Armatimonadetes bacterium]|nr:hypothetical protein [Armatimonadota bacterium]
MSRCTFRFAVYLALGAILLLRSPVEAQMVPPLIVHLALDRPIAVAGEPLSLEISVTNAWYQPFPAPNLAHYRPNSDLFIHHGILVPQVWNSEGRYVPLWVHADGPGVPVDEEVIMLVPGQTITVRVDVTCLWGFHIRPGDYAIAAPAITRSQSLKQLQPFVISNTAFVRILPRGAAGGRPMGAVEKEKLELAVRLSAGGRSARTAQAPVQLGKETYLPAAAAAELAGATLTEEKERLVLERDGKRLVFTPGEKAAVLPSGERKSGVVVPYAAGRVPMLPATLLAEVFGVPKEIQVRIEARG